MKFTQNLNLNPAALFQLKNLHLVALLTTLLLHACGSAESSSPPTTESSTTETSTTLPPGFMDEPPPPPSSNTLVLSGGVLLVETPITDSVIVLTDGIVLAWGRRGEVDMPNDSIGLDMRGKWIRAANSLTSGHTADLRVFDRYPTDETVTPIGSIVGSEVTMPAAD